MIYRIIYKIGEKLRNPSLQEKYTFLKASEKWSLDELEKYQLKKLKELLKIATDNSSFYKEKLKDINISEINYLSDLKKVPIITKEELFKYSSDVHTNINFKKQFVARTSGSSGRSLVFNREEAADSFNRAAIQRGYSWYNVNYWDRNGYFWGSNFSFLKKCKNSLLDKIQNRFRVFSFNEKQLKKFINKLKKARYVHGYSSMIYQTAVLINAKKLSKPSKIKMVKGTSEKILESYQEEIIEAFGSKIISEYGATEAGIIAFECPFGRMHINMEGVLVEEIDNEIVVTNLQMHSFPIIRYKLGDYIKLDLSGEKCKCGLEHQILEEVTGRIGENIYGFNKTYPSLYLYYIFKNLSENFNIELNYQVIQEQKGALTFLIEQMINTSEENKLICEIEKYFKKDISYEVKKNSTFSLQEKNKLKNFISKINE
ncbi:phenylacetate--CoA ligase family protein [Polaribacter sp. IC073]|uniref:phenylacetate--CoA ligase family protein n=1 Tax=Polaribacter sp. IC073 TaxID=2508540 RepID=UPI0011BECA54|nr:phenylacetate--CoA ligase family protein [Polaribacter sp. IC073]TXD49138.1 phenylacetate--CoA ligase family protein [Polaribacter sp. IC073]